MAISLLKKEYLLAGILLVLGALFYGFSCDRHYDITEVVVTEDQSIADDYFTGHVVAGHWPGDSVVPGYKGAAFLQAGDINGNGINEIICTSGIGESYDQYKKDGSVAIFTWDGEDVDSWQMHVIYDELGWPNETIIRDVDGDGLNDIMVMDGKLSQAFPSGIFYFKNLRNEITLQDNWDLKIIYQDETEDEELKNPAYHRIWFTDITGNGLEDFITTKLLFSKWKKNERFMWMEWFENNGDGTFTGPHEIGDGGGFYLTLMDVDGDGNEDVVASQYFIFDMDPPSFKVKEGIWGDSMLWFKNPGTQGNIYEPWERFTIDNFYTSKNPIGRGYDVIVSDLNNDGKPEMVVPTHNHQDFLPSGDERFWPSGIYLFNIPENPEKAGNWLPITIDAGDRALDLREFSPISSEYREAVDADAFAVDRSGSPINQGTPGHTRVADIYGNGRQDIVVAGDGKGVVYLYKNDGMQGSTLYLRRAVLYYDRECMPAEAIVLDIDKNGKKDIIISVYDSGNRKYRRESGSIFIFKQK